MRIDLTGDSLLPGEIVKAFKDVRGVVLEYKEEVNMPKPFELVMDVSELER